jgi:hypothetical protein
MLVNFTQLPDSAKVWVYQSSREFSAIEIDELNDSLSAFLTDWTAHGQDLQAGFLLPYNRFIVLGVNQDLHAASGCSIDASVRFIKSLESFYGLTLLDNTLVLYKQEDAIQKMTLTEFKKASADGNFKNDTIVFNNLIKTKSEFVSKWETTAQNSWHNRFLSQKKQAV